MTDATDLPWFVMSCDGIFPASTLRDHAPLPRGAWMTGHRIDYEVPTPLPYGLDPDYPGALLPFYKSGAPLFRADLLQALAGAGVDNLQLYDAVLLDPERNARHTDYKAVNIVGVVRGADLETSSLMGTTDSTLVDVDFARLAFAPSIPADLLMFRLAEAVNAIVVHARVRAAIEAGGIPGMTFFTTDEWSG